MTSTPSTKARHTAGVLSNNSIPDSYAKINPSDEFSNLHGLESSINKKESSSQYLADLKKIREAYVHDVKENHSTTSIPDFGEKSNPSDEISSEADESTESLLRPKKGRPKERKRHVWRPLTISAFFLCLIGFPS